MKILYVTNQSQTALPSIVYHGMKELGTKVLDYPRVPQYHCTLEDGLLVARDEHGKVVSKESKSEGRIIPLNSVGPRPFKWQCVVDPKYKYEKPDLDDFDQVVVTGVRRDNADLVGDVIKKASDRISFIDGDDFPFIQSIYFKSKVYFKMTKLKYDKLKYALHPMWIGIGGPYSFTGGNARYLPLYLRHLDLCAWLPQLWDSKKMPGLNVTVPPHTYPKLKIKYADRKYDIVFIANWKSKDPQGVFRKEFGEYLVEFCKKNKLSCFVKLDGSVPWSEYVKIIQNSRLSLSLPGAGIESMRYWETPHYGSTLVSIRSPLYIRDDFEDMKSAIFFSTKEEFEEKVLRVLKRNMAEEIGREGGRHYQKYHTAKKRAEFVVKTLAEQIS